MGYKEDFILLMVRSNVLMFGDFTTKSGRKTPYFINTGKFKTGKQMLELGKFYAKCYNENIHDDNVILFGPAYKGIPLVALTATQLASEFNVDLPFFFNRKEAKDHGEGGVFVGETPTKDRKIVVIEDVVTAGTALRESMELFKPLGVEIKAVIISCDRMEKGPNGISTIKELERDYNISVYSIVNIHEIVDYLYNREIDGKVIIDDELMIKIKAYWEQYGA